VGNSYKRRIAVENNYYIVTIGITVGMNYTWGWKFKFTARIDCQKLLLGSYHLKNYSCCYCS
jgi:hypothetical protein